MLTKKQEIVLKAIYLYIQANGISPTVRNICDLVGVKSSATGYSHLNVLESRGYITRKETIPRSIGITEKGMKLIK